MFTISVDDRDIRLAMQALSDRLLDMRPALDAIGMEIEGRVSARFESESDPSGRAWAALKPGTIRSYPKGGNNRILDRFGDMLDSLGHYADQDSVTIGFGKDYAVYHEFGTRKMVRRGLLTDDPVARTLTPEDERTVLDILNLHLREAL